MKLALALRSHVARVAMVLLVVATSVGLVDSQKSTRPNTAVFDTRFVATGGGAPAGRTLHFQGVLSDPSTGNPLNGSFNMAFSIIAAETGGTALWSETQPNVQVKKGVFNVQLGSVLDFPTDLYDTSPLYIEMTVNPPSPPLSPRILIARTGNAFHADKADDVKNDAITKEKIRDKAVGHDKLEDKAVDHDKINDKAVKREKIEDKAIDKGKLEDKAVDHDKINDKAVKREKIEDKAIGRSKLDDNAIGGAQVEDGSITAADLAAGAVTTSELAGDVLNYVRSLPGARPGFGTRSLGASTFEPESDVVIGVDGLPLVAAFVDDGDGLKLKIIHCNDAACASDTRTVVSTAADASAQPAVLVGADGRPYVLFTAGALSVARCLDTACSAVGATQGVQTNAGTFGGDLSAALTPLEGKPIIATANGVVECVNVDCTSADVIGSPGSKAKLVVGSNGNIYAVGLGNQGVTLMTCALSCRTNATPTQIPVTGSPTDVAITVSGDGLPVIGYVLAQLNLVHCLDAACSTHDDIEVPTPTSADLAAATTGDDGVPLFFVLGPTSSELRVLRCTSAACGDVTDARIDGSMLGLGEPSLARPAVTIGADGMPIIVHAYGSGPTTVRAIHCSNRYCVPFYREH